MALWRWQPRRSLILVALAGALCALNLSCGGGSSGEDSGGRAPKASGPESESSPGSSAAAFRARVRRTCANVEKEIVQLSRTPGTEANVNAVSWMGSYSLTHEKVPAGLAKPYAVFLHWLELRKHLRADLFRSNLSDARRVRDEHLYRVYTQRGRRAAEHIGLHGCPFR